MPSINTFASKRSRAILFQVALACGFVLGILLLVETILTYRHVTGTLVLDHLTDEAGHYASLLENRARDRSIDSFDTLRSVFDELISEHPEQLAWFRAYDRLGAVVGESRGADLTTLPMPYLQSVLTGTERNVRQTRDTPKGPVVVVAMPFRLRFPAERPPFRANQPPRSGEPRFRAIEVALYLEGASSTFLPLRRNLVVGTAAAIALVASMIVMGVRFRSYLRAHDIEQQLSIARQVQQELLPRGCPGCAEIEFAAECQPAWEVGGDFYDVYPDPGGRTVLVLGDVSGKGLPAALLMGVLHGAVRTASAIVATSSLSEMVTQINGILYSETPREVFASMFVGVFERDSATLSYVNAGHNPPLLLRRGDNGPVLSDRLETGGPVLGLLPHAPFEEGKLTIQRGDLLVLYSDGVVEAANQRDEEFGEEGVLTKVSAHFSEPVSEIQAAVLRGVRQHSVSTAPQDDLTVVVARFTPSGGIGQPAA